MAKKKEKKHPKSMSDLFKCPECGSRDIDVSFNGDFCASAFNDFDFDCMKVYDIFAQWN